MSDMWLHGVKHNAKWVGLALVAALGLTPCQVAAGERIIIGIQQNPNEPTQEKELGKETFKLWNRSGGATDVSAPLMTPPSAPPPPRDKRSQRAEDERRWWMVLSPGELQQKPEDEDQGWLASPSRDKQLEPDKNRLSRPGDYTFYGMEKSQRGANYRQTQTASADEEENTARGDKSDAWRSLFGEAGGPSGKKTEDKSRYGSSRLNTDSESMLHDFLKEMSVQSFSPAQQIRPWENNTRPNQTADLNASRPWNDPVNTLPGLGNSRSLGGDPLPSASPVMPNLPQTAGPRVSDNFSSFPGSEAGAPRTFSTGIPSLSNPRSPLSGFGAPAAQPSLSDPRSPMPNVMSPMFNRDLKQRSGL